MPGQSGYISLSESYCSSTERSHHSVSLHSFHCLLLCLSLPPTVLLCSPLFFFYATPLLPPTFPSLSSPLCCGVALNTRNKRVADAPTALKNMRHKRVGLSVRLHAERTAVSPPSHISRHVNHLLSHSPLPVHHDSDFSQVKRRFKLSLRAPFDLQDTKVSKTASLSDLLLYLTSHPHSAHSRSLRYEEVSRIFTQSADM